MWNSLPRTFVQPQPVNPFKKIPCVEMEDLPSGDLAAINPRQHKNASNSTSESHLEPWHSTPKPKPSGDNITCPKSVGDSKLNFGKMQDPSQGLGARSKVCSTKTMHPVSPYNTSAKSNGNPDLENSTIQKQRNELQLLVIELKDRDRELNEMVAAHQKQLLAWEEDRLRILTLEEKCAKLENELRKRNELIRTLTTQHKILEAQQNDCLKVLNSVQQQLQETNHKAGEAASNCEELEERNKTLNTSMLELSAQVGQLQAREQELSTMLKLKDKDMVEATNHIIDLSARFKTLESALREARLNETNTRKEVQDCKQHAKRLRHEICKLRDELDEKTGENNEQREEIIHLKQENQYLISELTLAVEREKRKDQLLELAKSKQERADTELHGLRQVNEKQQHDLQLLHLNLATSQELIQKQEEKILEISTSKLSESDTTRQGRDGRNQIEGHEYRKWRTEAAREQRKDSFSSTGRHKEELAKALQPKQDQEFELSVNPSREQSASEAGNANYGRRCGSEARGAQSPSQRDYDHSSPALSSYNPQAIASDYMKNLTKYVLSKQTPRLPDGSPPRGGEESGPVGRQWRSEGPQDGKGPESAEPARSGGSYPNPEHRPAGCGGCHCSSARQPPAASASLWETLKLQERYGGGELVERGAGEEGPRFPVRKGEVAQKPPKSDPEWMNVYQPSTDVKDLWWLYLNDGSVVPPALDNPKCARKKSEETLEMDMLGLESPIPIHNNSPLRDRSRRSKGNYHEDLIDNSIAASPGKLPNAEDSGLGSASTNSTCRDDCSPTSKLQRLLAESRQMVANLERSTQVPPGLACSSSGNTREASSR